MSEHFQDLGGGYFRVVIRLRKQCAHCAKPFRTDNPLFDNDSMWSENKTARALGWVTRWGNYEGDDICLDCHAKLPPKPTSFKCAHCGEKRPLKQVEREKDGEQYCSVCYSTLTAKEWDNLFEDEFEETYPDWDY